MNCCGKPLLMMWDANDQGGPGEWSECSECHKKYPVEALRRDYISVDLAHDMDGVHRPRKTKREGGPSNAA